MTELPYSIEVYFALMGDYNDRWVVFVAMFWLLGAAAAALNARPPGWWRKWQCRIVPGYLAVCCLWVGGVHQFQMMAGLNFMAPYYGAVWIAQGLLLVWAVLAPDRLGPKWTGPMTSGIPLAQALIALAAYPFVVLAQGSDWIAVPMSGSAPNPTAMLILGLLLGLPKVPWVLFLMPLAWAVVAGMGAHLLDHGGDYLVPIVIGAAYLTLIFRCWSAKR